MNGDTVSIECAKGHIFSGYADTTKCPVCNPPANYWTVEEAGADASKARCIHDIPLNVFCDKCEHA